MDVLNLIPCQLHLRNARLFIVLDSVHSCIGWTNLSVAKKKPAGILTGTELNSKTSSGRMAILKSIFLFIQIFNFFQQYFVVLSIQG